MTDREKLINLFDGFGVEYKSDDKDNSIECMQGNKKIEGYGGFFTYFEFTKEGEFITMGAAE